jgi:glucose-1-phosphate adenylyltransferase
MEPNIVILAGGISSRMKKPADGSLDARLLHDAEMKSKAMIGVGKEGRPFLDYLLRNADAAGYRDAVIVVGERDTSVREHYGSADRGNRFLNLTISYAVQPIPEGRTKPLGTADALMWALQARPDWAGARLSVCNSDNLYSVGALRQLLASTDAGALVDYDRDALAFPPERVQQFAVIEKDGLYLRSILEKPGPDDIARAAGPGGRVGVSMNIWRFSYDTVLPAVREVPLNPVRLEKELPSAVMMLVQADPRSFRVYERAEHVPDLTDRNDIGRVQEYLARLGPTGQIPGP